MTSNHNISEESIITCHDAYLHGLLKENELCFQCNNYSSLVEKKRAQSEMGKWYQCEDPAKYSIEEINAAVPPTPPRTRKRQTVVQLSLTDSASSKRKIERVTGSSINDDKEHLRNTEESRTAVTNRGSTFSPGTAEKDPMTGLSMTNGAIRARQWRARRREQCSNVSNNGVVASPPTWKTTANSPNTGSYPRPLVAVPIPNMAGSKTLESLISANDALRHQFQEAEKAFQEILMHRNEEISRLSKLLISAQRFESVPNEHPGARIDHDEEIIRLSKLMEEKDLEINRLTKIVASKDTEISIATRNAYNYYCQLSRCPTQSAGGANHSNSQKYYRPNINEIRNVPNIQAHPQTQSASISYPV